MFVLTGVQVVSSRFVRASTTTGMLVAQEIMKPNSLLFTPKLERFSRISGLGRNHSAVGTS